MPKEHKMSQIEYVQVPVPKPLVPSVMSLIAKHMAEESDGIQDTEAPADESKIIEIKKELAERMFKESGKAMRKVLRALAKHPGTAVPSSDVAQEVFGSPSGRQLSGVMGAFGHRCSGRYNGLKPFKSEWNFLEYRWEYTMPANIAKWVSTL
jgi:hypothetical protein